MGYKLEHQLQQHPSKHHSWRQIVITPTVWWTRREKAPVILSCHAITKLLCNYFPDTKKKEKKEKKNLVWLSHESVTLNEDLVFVALNEDQSQLKWYQALKVSKKKQLSAAQL